MSELTAREAALLKTLVETYISDGQPVGSKTLVETCGLEVSSATIRNVMKDLEDLGYIASPYTSAGRIPTESGYRLFIDSMINIKPLKPEFLQQYESSFDVSRINNSSELLQSATNAISNITKLAGVISLPRHQDALIQQVEFIKLTGNRALVVLVMADGDVQNKIIRLDREYSKSEFTKASNYLSEHYAGMNVKAASFGIRAELEDMQDQMNTLMTTIIQLGTQTFSVENSDELVTAGETHLMSYDELSDIKQLKELFEAFNKKRDILHILDKCSDASGVKIFIGHESGYSVLDHCSIVTAPYELANGQIGVLGVIGPTRIAYDKVIPIVDATSQILSKALNSG